MEKRNAAEEVFVLETGDKVKVVVSLFLYNDRPEYKVELWTCKKRARTWIHYTFDDYEWRRMTMPERAEHKRKKQEELVGFNRIYEVKMKLWNQLKP